MFASILIGSAGLIAISLSCALFSFAHLTGRIRRSTALVVAMLALAAGAAIAAGGVLGILQFGRTAVPFGVGLMLAAGINGLLAYQARRA